jgi:putative membrane protein
VILVIAAANVHLLGAYAAALLALCPLVFILNRQWYRQLGYALTDDHFLVRRGWLKRSTAIIPLQNVQSVAWVQRPWERRAALASLLVDAAGEDYTGGIPRLPYLPLAQAEELLRRLARAGAERPFAW